LLKWFLFMPRYACAARGRSSRGTSDVRSISPNARATRDRLRRMVGCGRKLPQNSRKRAQCHLRDGVFES
jgi:hypothetical protein